MATKKKKEPGISGVVIYFTDEDGDSDSCTLSSIGQFQKYLDDGDFDRYRNLKLAAIGEKYPFSIKINTERIVKYPNLSKDEASKIEDALKSATLPGRQDVKEQEEE